MYVLLLATIPILLLLVLSYISAYEPENDPCNYHGLNICDSSGKCDKEEFDCYTDDCVNGETGITGQCDGDDDTLWCWDSQQENGKCTSTLLVINLTNSNVLNDNNTYSSFDTSNGIVINKNDNFSTFVTSFSSPIAGCDFVDEKVYSLNNTTLPGEHFIRYAEGQLKAYDDTSLSNSFIPSAWGSGIPAGCIKYLLFDFDDKELYFFGDTFKKQGSRTLSGIESNELVKMAEGLFAFNTTDSEPEFVASPCLDYCPGTSFTEFKNQTYLTWSAPSNAILYPRPSDATVDTHKPEIFEYVDAIGNKMMELCGCIK